MKGNDLEVGLSRRVFVHADAVRTLEDGSRKLFGLISVPTQTYTYDKAALNRLWHFTNRAGVDLTLFAFPDTDLDDVAAHLDAVGLNPFHYTATFADAPALARELPYLPGALAVVDIPSRAMAYGHWGRDLKELS